jgi:hypothetical protein
MFMEQNFGPHIEQKCASLKPSSGSVSSCMERAVSGSSESSNWRFQSKRVAGARELVVAIARAGPVPRDIGGVGRDLVRDEPGLHVFPVGQAQVLLGRHVAEHGSAVPADHGRADRRRDVVVARRDIGDQRPQRVERRLVAHLVFLLHLQLDLVQRDVAGPFDHHLHIVLPGLLGQLAQRLQLRELRFVAGIGDAAGPQPSPSEKLTSCFWKILQMSSKHS